MVLNLPSVMELASYVWYTQACALGVFFEFSDYKRFIERTHEYKDVPSPIIASLKWFIASISFLVLYTVLNPYFSIETCYTKEYSEFNYPYRLFFYVVSMTVKRCFYYNAFCMTTGAVIASGLGYNGKDKQTGHNKWDKIVGVYVILIETASSPVECLRGWNH